MSNSQSLSLLSKFLGKVVVVNTSAGPVLGVLIKAELSAHEGIGNLLLQTQNNSWALIKEWTYIKR